jgi:hypothetical protein
MCLGHRAMWYRATFITAVLGPIVHNFHAIHHIHDIVHTTKIVVVTVGVWWQVSGLQLRKAGIHICLCPSVRHDFLDDRN